MDITDLIKSKDGCEESFWIKVNVNQTGFYRVKYDDILSARLGQAIEANILSPTDRFGNYTYYLLYIFLSNVDYL